MVTQYFPIRWEEAVKGFFLHKRAVREIRTGKRYRGYVRQLAYRAESEGVSPIALTRRHPDSYLAFRSDSGRGPTTPRHEFSHPLRSLSGAVGTAVSTAIRWPKRSQIPASETVGMFIRS